jgi:hypothetical protein
LEKPVKTKMYHAGLHLECLPSSLLGRRKWQVEVVSDFRLVEMVVKKCFKTSHQSFIFLKILAEALPRASSSHILNAGPLNHSEYYFEIF